MLSLSARTHSLSKLKPFLRSISSLARSPSSSSIAHSNPLTEPQNPQHTPQSYLLFRHFSAKPLARDGNYDEAASRTHRVCPGCGVHMQSSDSKNPGFFVNPSTQIPKSLRFKPDNLSPISPVPEFADSLKTGLMTDSETPNPPDSEKPATEKPVVCARCHSLRHYGRVKDPTVENLLPDFDFRHTVGRKIATSRGTRSVVLMVVDASDFDGSFPRKAASLVSASIDENSAAWKEGKPGNVPRVVLVATKIDLLPSALMSPTRLEHWVRQRAREGGSNKLTSVHMVSSVRGWGMRNLVDDVAALAGPRGNVWAVGAQNAGKSTLLNAMAKSVGDGVGEKVTHLTEAPVPGTTLGILRVEGVLPGQAKMFDTPGLLHPHQITTRLTRDEQKLVNVTKELKPRTYRIKAGHSIHIAGLVRLDVEELSVDSVYITVWASVYLPLHMGKTENAGELVENHFGRQLQPPIGEERTKELGQWVRKEFQVSGNSWDSSSVDIAASGLGWFAIGLKGDAKLGIWTYDGIDVVLRNSMIPNRAQIFEVAGFSVSKIVSKADQTLNKDKRKQSNLKEAKSEEPASLSTSTESVSC